MSKPRTVCIRGIHYRMTGESIKSAPDGAWPNSGEQKNWRCAPLTTCCILLTKHLWLEHSCSQCFCNVQTEGVVLLKWHMILLPSTIQGRCCFVDETPKEVKKHFYTCGHYHYVCKQHFGSKSCAKCKGKGHKYDKGHTEHFPKEKTFWLDHSYSSIA